jgi:transitional endoplasmic reticulum ATPase
VGADLRALVDAAALTSASRRDAEATVTAEDFSAALKVVRASTASSAIEPGGLTLDAVKGVDSVKEELVESVLWPLSYPDTFERLGVAPPRGILLYGPPGCGKTYLVKALAGEGKANVFSIKGAELLSKYVGESEAAVRDVFRRAREASPSIIFLDEVDSLAPPRGKDNNGTTDRVVASLLTELDGVEGLRGVVVIGATNRPDLVDPALTRPGRLGRMVFLPPPDAGARRDMLEASGKTIPFSGDINWEEVSEKTEGYSAADCTALVTEAAMIAMREDMAASVVEPSHLEKALEKVRPSLDPVQVAELEAYAAMRELR